jgi:hypothetical protein
MKSTTDARIAVRMLFENVKCVIFKDFDVEKILFDLMLQSCGQTAGAD